MKRALMSFSWRVEVVASILLLAHSSPSLAADACASFVARDGADQFDITPPIGFVDVCSQDAVLCRKLTETVAKDLGIDEVVAEVLPDEKAAAVKGLQQGGHVVVMAGDGINDAPALVQANVGIAMGTGADIAVDSADAALLKGDLRGILRALALSRATMANIKQNLFFAFVYNTIGVPLAAGILYPHFGILLSPMLAAAAMSFSSVSVITNALRLRTKHI
jgi:Cu+-exporting ATPase